MRHERNVEGLKQNAQKKRQEAVERTEQGIKTLLKEGRAVNFKTVAEASNVSTAWLYKEPQIKERIEHLRQQQVEKKSLPAKQKASDASKDAMIKTLKERIKKQELEIRGLRNHIEVVQGIAMQVKDLNKQIGALTTENSLLKEQLDKCLSSTDVGQTTKQNSKVTSLSKRKSTHPPTISDQIQSELDELGVGMNSTLAKQIGVAPEEVVLVAINALKEALATREVHNPSGFLVEAIRNAWMPNRGYEQLLIADSFNEWFPVAKSLGLVIASMQQEEVLYIMTAQQQWIAFDVMVSDYPLEKLREMA